MKKLLFLVAALAIIGSAAAQTNKQTKKFTYGPKIGLNFSDMSINVAEMDKSNGIKPAMAFGAFAEYRTCNWFAVSVDALYSRQGSKVNRALKSQDINTSTTTDYRLQYLNIPIMANFYVTKGLALKVGFQPGFLLGAKLKTTTDGTATSLDMKDAFKTVDFSVPVGISYTFKMGLMIDARYNISVTDIASSTLKEAIALKGGVLNNIKNNVFTLSVGWKF